MTVNENNYPNMGEMSCRRQFGQCFHLTTGFNNRMASPHQITLFYSFSQIVPSPRTKAYSDGVFRFYTPRPWKSLSLIICNFIVDNSVSDGLQWLLFEYDRNFQLFDSI